MMNIFLLKSFDAFCENIDKIILVDDMTTGFALLDAVSPQIMLVPGLEQDTYLGAVIKEYHGRCGPFRTKNAINISAFSSPRSRSIVNNINFHIFEIRNKRIKKIFEYPQLTAEHTGYIPESFYGGGDYWHAINAYREKTGETSIDTAEMKLVTYSILEFNTAGKSVGINIHERFTLFKVSQAQDNEGFYPDNWEAVMPIHSCKRTYAWSGKEEKYTMTSETGRQYVRWTDPLGNYTGFSDTAGR